MKRIAAYLILFFNIVQLNAQQLPFFDLTTGGSHLSNPAAISTDFLKYNLATEATVNYRTQWTGFEGAPQTTFGNFGHWMDDFNTQIGGSLIQDQTGPLGFMGVYGMAAYGIEFNPDWMLSVGISGGIVQYRVKGNELNFLESDDIATENVTKLFPDFSIGAMLYFDRKYFIGVSVPQTFGLDLSFRDNANDFSIQRIQHYQAVGGVLFELEDDSWVESRIWAKYVEGTPVYVGGNIHAELSRHVYINLGGSSAKSFTIGAGGMINMGFYSNLLRIGYAYTNFFGQFGPYFRETHEFKVSFGWNGE
ncbi:MAG: PorP/SprF family type IX secretion system membrane protein [Bacteroidetes bacterium]|jgi:type IX secretion system PorP/SprF family membrane protein|nr:PorP/SprF family type IX secretion system membrane protein [Bacteroidota bacterium]MDF1863965.1 PorP/SprF family type IX secretion system membrane protein [Saprospiraceae bacterium]